MSGNNHTLADYGSSGQKTLSGEEGPELEPETDPDPNPAPEIEGNPENRETVDLDVPGSWGREDNPSALGDPEIGYVDEYNGLLFVQYRERSDNSRSGWKAYYCSEEYHERYHLTDPTTKDRAIAAAERFSRGNWYGGDFAAELQNGEITLDVGGEE